MKKECKKGEKLMQEDSKKKNIENNDALDSISIDEFGKIKIDNKELKQMTDELNSSDLEEVAGGDVNGISCKISFMQR